MLFSKAQICPKLAAASLLSVVLVTSLPVRAEEDTNTFNSMLGFFGMQFDKDTDAIDYHARAPLVVPPNKADLPRPVSKEDQRTAAWPNDPDAAERRRKAADSHQPAPQVTPNSSGRVPAAELTRGSAGEAPVDGQSPSDCQASAGTPFCLYAPWDQLKHMIGGGDDKLIPGPAPQRKYLTEPPSQYRSPSKDVVLVKETPKNEPDPADAAAYARAQHH